MSKQQGFAVMDDQPNYEITIKLRWGIAGPVGLDELQAALTNAYASAFAEVAKRLEADRV